MNAQNRARRDFLMAAAGAVAMTSAWSRAGPSSEPSSIAAIEGKVGGRVGVFALDSGTDKILAHRPDERFAMCSTFKWLLAASVLAGVDRAALSLDERIFYGKADLLSYAPATGKHAAAGFMTIRELIRAAVVVSDNTAANLLLSKLGGPSAVTAYARSCEDTVTRLDRNEPALNGNEPGDPRDTTSPRAMANLMRTVVCGDRLSIESRNFLLQCLFDCETGHDRLRAGLPVSWVVGDKTGTGGHRSVNDVAIAIPPGRPPILIAVYLSEGNAERATLVAAHASIGRVVGAAFCMKSSCEGQSTNALGAAPKAAQCWWS